MNKLKMAACGVDCNECAQYKATTEQDLQAAELIVEWFRDQGWIGENEGAEAVVKKDPICKGCWSDHRWCGCGETDFRMCCERKEINHCSECNDFPCEHYKEWASCGGTHQKAMEFLLSLKAKP